MTKSDNYSYLPITLGNILVHIESKRTQKKGMDNDDDYYDEINLLGEVVAKFHIWHYMNIYPPHHSNEGWDKFDSQGIKIASGQCL